MGSVSVSLLKETVFEEPTREISNDEAARLKLRYYDSEVHRGSFILPRFARKVHDKNEKLPHLPFNFAGIVH